MKRDREKQHSLLLAQNFLLKIGRGDIGSPVRPVPSWTEVQEWKNREVKNSTKSTDDGNVKFDLGAHAADSTATILQVTAEDQQPFYAPLQPPPPAAKRSYASDIDMPDGCSSSSSFPQALSSVPEKKTSFLKKFVKILSSDDVITSKLSREEEVPLNKVSIQELNQNLQGPVVIRSSSPDLEESAERERPSSPFSMNSFHFFRKLRSSIGNKGESVERIRQISHCSVDELKPFDFSSDEEDASELNFAHLLGRGRRLRPSPQVGAMKRERDRRDSHFVDSIGDVAMIDDLKEMSFEEGDDIDWDDSSSDSSYDPTALDDMELTGKTVIKTPGFVGVSFNFEEEDILKANLNSSFSDKYPRIGLTYSKFKSIKGEMIDIAQMCGLDLITICYALVYFEKIVLKNLVSKTNRKPVAGVSLLIAAKLNDCTKEQVRSLIDHSVENFRISRKEMLSYELPLCVALQFDLSVSDAQVEPHYRRLVILTES